MFVLRRFVKPAVRVSVSAQAWLYHVVNLIDKQAGIPWIGFTYKKFCFSSPHRIPEA